ncbi:MAG TPA: response regulator [Candidatus Binataceae bacterium]|nr:response regulator [Candidatus Binataceae bacterium]
MWQTRGAGWAGLQLSSTDARRGINSVHKEKDQGDTMSVGSGNSGRDILELERDQLVVGLCRPKQPRLRVLVVEDEPDAQTLLKFILEPKYEVITASSGEEMRVQLEANSERLSLVLMDLKLAGDEDGVMLTKALRSESRWKNIPIVALTACATGDDLRRAIEAGCDDYVPKPFYRRQLTALVERLIDNAQPAEDSQA